MAKRNDCYTDEEKDEIISHVLVQVACGRSVSEILSGDEVRCDQATFWRWHLEDWNDLRGNLARARENGVEARMEEAVHVARTPMMGEIVTVEKADEDDDTETITKVRKEDMLGHRKLLVDTLIKSAQMLKPKTYGPKLDLTSGGEQLGVTDALEAARRRAERALDKKDGE